MSDQRFRSQTLLDLSYINYSELHEVLDEIWEVATVKFADFEQIRCDSYMKYSCSRPENHSGPHIALYAHGRYVHKRILQIWEYDKIYFDIESCKAWTDPIG